MMHDDSRLRSRLASSTMIMPQSLRAFLQIRPSVNWEVFRNRLRTVSERLKPNKGILFQISRYIWYIYIEKKFKIAHK
jgi:hypothetical protein